MTGEQLVEDDAQRVDIRRGGCHAPVELLGGCIPGSERVFGGSVHSLSRGGRSKETRLSGWPKSRASSELGAEDFRDPEIEKFGNSLLRYQNVRRLEITMNDEALMREANGVARGAEQSKTFVD